MAKTLCFDTGGKVEISVVELRSAYCVVQPKREKTVGLAMTNYKNKQKKRKKENNKEDAHLLAPSKFTRARLSHSCPGNPQEHGRASLGVFFGDFGYSSNDTVWAVKNLRSIRPRGVFHRGTLPATAKSPRTWL